MSGLRRFRAIFLFTGAFMTLAALTLTRAAMSNHRAGAAPEPPRDVIVTAHLQQIGMAFYDYADHNNGRFPDKLSTLYPGTIPNPAWLWNPGDSDPCPTTITNDNPDQVDSTQVSFHYFGSGKRDSDHQFIVLQDNSLTNNNGAGVYAYLWDAYSSYNATFFAPSAEPLAFTQASRTNLQIIGTALTNYANANQGHFPPSLSKLYPGYISDPAVFWNPGDNLFGDPVVPTTIDNDTPDEANSAQISYAYLGAGFTTACNPGTILVQDNSPSNNGGAVINILAADMSVTSFVRTVQCSDPASCRVRAQGNLSQIARALYDYAYSGSSHDHSFPTNLSMLYRKHIYDPSAFWNPGDSDSRPLIIDNDNPNQANSAQVSFAYFGGKAGGKPLSVVLGDNSLANNDGLGVYVVTPDSSCQFLELSSTPPSLGAASRANLQQIGVALLSYANDNLGHFPPSLSKLYPSYLSDPAVFWNPGDNLTGDPSAPTTIDNDVPNKANSAQISYAYLGAGYTTSCDPNLIVVQDNSLSNNAGTMLNILTADGQVAPFVKIVQCSNPASCRMTAQSNLRQIGNALYSYATVNDGVLPEELSTLYRTQLHDPAVFWNPGDSDPCPILIDNNLSDQPNSTQVSFAYFGGDIDDDGTAVVALDNSLGNNGGSGVHVLTADSAAAFFEESDRLLPSSEIARARLGLIGQALLAYASDNNNQFPAKLSMLYPAYVADPTVFWNPGDNRPGDPPVPTTIDNDLPNHANSAQISYHYRGTGYRSDCAPSVVLAADNSLANNGGIGINIATADGNAEYFAPVLPSSTFPPSCLSIASANLRSLGTALYTYTTENGDYLPTKLSMLYRHFIGTPTAFWNPGDSDLYPLTIDNDGLNQPNSSQISFEYLAAGQRLSDLPYDTIIVRDNSPENNGGNGTVVLFADSHVEYIPIRTVAGLAITSGPDTVPEGGSVAFTATATYTDGATRDVTPYSLWFAFFGGGSITQQGVYTAPASVTADTPVTILVRYYDQTATMRCAEKILTVLNTVRVLTGVSISSGPDTVPEGGGANYTCTASYEDGSTEDVTASATWSVASGSGSFPTPGAYAAPSTVLADTPATIHVSYSEGGVTKDADKAITVLNSVRILSSVSISSGPSTVPEGGTANYTCTATYDDGSTQDATASATWSVAAGPGSFPTPGAYAAPGTVLADTPATIHASYTEGGVTDDADKAITVLNSIRILSSVSISSGPDTIPEGGTASYVCTATYDDGSTQNVTASATWSVTIGPGSFTSPGAYAAPSTVLADTPVTIHVKYVRNGVTREADKGITVLNSIRFLKSLAISSEPATVPEGGTANFTCTATYDDNTTQEVTASATWSVISGPGSFTSPGVYAAPPAVTADTAAKLQAIYVEAGWTRLAFKDITVQNTTRALSHVSISGPATVQEGGTADYTCTATYDDNTTQDVTASATWSVITGPGSFPSSGVYVAPTSVLADTPATIRASYEEGLIKRADKDITVTNSVRVLTGLSIWSGPATVNEGGNAGYTARATYDDSSTQDVTASGTWSVISGPGSFSAPGTYVAPASVSADTAVTIHVSYTEGGITKEADKSITVQDIPRVLSSVAISSGPDTVSEGAIANYTCTATYEDATTQNVTATAVWNVTSGPGSFTSPGKYAAPASLAATTTATIRATYTESGIARQASKNITVEKPSTPPPLANDADGDGVLDTADQCPGTPADATVDANGCAASQRDNDDDGVTDDKDQCPDTPSGTAVDANGCPKADPDQDGITNDSDNCPNVSNADQLDSDGDGLGNACDQCPDDANKSEPGNCGCGQPEAADCGLARMFTVRVVSADGSSAPYSYAAGTWAQIAAPPAPEGMRFSHWTGDLTGSDNPAQLYVDGDKNITANYETCPLERRLPCGAGTPVCGLTSMLALGLLKLRSRRRP